MKDFLKGLALGLLIAFLLLQLVMLGNRIVSNETSSLTTSDFLQLMAKCHMTMDGVIHTGSQPAEKE